MPDNKKKTGKGDDIRVSAKQPYEVAYVAKKAKVTPAAAKKAIEKAGPMRKNVEKALKKR